MWQDALRVCKEYIPHKLQALQDEYEKEVMNRSTRLDLNSQGHICPKVRHHVLCKVPRSDIIYLKVTYVPMSDISCLEVTYVSRSDIMSRGQVQH